MNTAFNTRFVRIAGLGLALTHLLTALTWQFGNFIERYVTDDTSATCHAFFISCLDFHFQKSQLTVSLMSYAGLSLLSALCFCRPRWLKIALISLAIISVFKILFFLLRFNVMGNYHLLHFILILVFFFCPRKQFSLTLTTVILYVLAGLLKINTEWLSGAALTSRPFLEGKWLGLALAYVVILETVVTWGLLSSQRWVRALTLAQLTIFHLFSWHIVGFFYPVTMFLLLLPQYAGLVPSWQEHTEKFRIRDLRPTTAFFLILLIAFNLWPLLQGQDPALQGQYRSLRINMLDARPDCRPLAFLVEDKQTIALNLIASTSLRTRCDTSVFETQLREYCKNKSAAARIEYTLYSKRSLDESFQIIVNETNICTRLIHENN